MLKFQAVSQCYTMFFIVFLGSYLDGLWASRRNRPVQEEDGRLGKLFGRTPFKSDGNHTQNTSESVCELQDGTPKAELSIYSVNIFMKLEVT